MTCNLHHRANSKILLIFRILWLVQKKSDTKLLSLQILKATPYVFLKAFLRSLGKFCFLDKCNSEFDFVSLQFNLCSMFTCTLAVNLLPIFCAEFLKVFQELFFMYSIYTLTHTYTAIGSPPVVTATHDFCDLYSAGPCEAISKHHSLGTAVQKQVISCTLTAKVRVQAGQR